MGTHAVSHRILIRAGAALLAVMSSRTAVAGELSWWTDGDPIVSHPPTRGGGGASDTDFQTVWGQRLWQRRADEVLLDEPATVRRIVWWGFYDLDNPPAAETMRARFYDARPGDGLPGNVLFEEEFLNPSRTSTGARVPGGIQISNEYVFLEHLREPFKLMGETPYWFEVVQIGDPETHFRWEDGFGILNGHAFINPLVGGWRHTGGAADLAFELLSIPEPSALLLLVMCVGLAALQGRSARRSLRE